MEEGKIKNTITRSFELNDYRIEGTELSGFWADLLNKEELTVEVNYKPEKKKVFSPKEIETLVQNISEKCDIFQALIPKNIKCEATFKDLEGIVYTAGQSELKPNPRELEELKIKYRFYVAYYI